MKNARFAIFSFSIAFAMVTSLVCITPASGAINQWFPSNGTNCDYEMARAIQYKNNTVEKTNLFDVYIISNIIYVVPSVLHYKPAPSSTSIKNNTPVIWRNTYKEISVSQLNRTTSIVVDNVSYQAVAVNIYESNLSSNQEMTTSLIFQKNGYYLGALNRNFLDYFNCSAKIGDIVENSVFSEYSTVYGITDSQIIALYNSSSPGENFTRLIIADKTGRVSQLVWLDYRPGIFGQLNAHSVYISFTATSPSPASDYSTYILYGVIGVACFVVGLLLGVAAGKRKRK